MSERWERLKGEIAACRLCEGVLPHRPRPVVQIHPEAVILIAGQAPGRKVHQSGVPFDDASGDRLRSWLGIDKATFYDPRRVAILPMGFCWPGTGASGDLPPRPECAPAWRAQVLAELKQIKLTLLIGAYAQQWHLGKARISLTKRVRAWRETGPHQLALPHPSPRNNIWLRKNPWFEDEVLPYLRQTAHQALAAADGV